MWLSISVWDLSEFDADIGLLFAAAQHESADGQFAGSAWLFFVSAAIR
jgi:hypothetical protein